MKGVPDQLLKIFAGKGGKLDIVDDRSSLTNCLQLTHQRMRRVHFVIPVGTDQQQVRHIGLAQHVLDQIQRRSIEPLQVVEKQCKGMFRSRKNADETAEHHLEPTSSVLRRKFRNAWLVPYNEPQFGNKIYNQLTIRI